MTKERSKASGYQYPSSPQMATQGPYGGQSTATAASSSSQPNPPPYPATPAQEMQSPQRPSSQPHYSSQQSQYRYPENQYPSASPNQPYQGQYQPNPSSQYQQYQQYQQYPYPAQSPMAYPPAQYAYGPRPNHRRPSPNAMCAGGLCAGLAACCALDVLFDCLMF
ncbi:MAG: hypothetical protein DHS80DRAFT_25004 [Piptocephalis tieghemiana]|nr:MAG: hypothetical protein DHS80DRAFT_25004 [Piptocephalis tieghemiana]